ncbi:Sodium/calcium exchanger protein-domain-containing protein [Flagelloscypha sp. PMI_526]|nr:Sodium/calcium exchanger protein-domain-containing protein [Flagelloscypha sp. PMI_526]
MAMSPPAHHTRSMTQSTCSSSQSSLPLYASPKDSSEQPLRRHRLHPCEVFRGWQYVLFGSCSNILIFIVPAAWSIRFAFPNSPVLIFSLCLLALIPLVKLHDLCVRELAKRMGGSKAGLMNASLSNLIELVVAVSALRQCELRVVQNSLVGAILTKLLLVLGLSLFAGGIRFKEQGFNHTSTQVNSSLLSIGVGAVLLPAAYHFSLSGGSDAVNDSQKANILMMSRAVSAILLVIYSMYLIFQLFSHSHLFEDTGEKSHKNEVPEIFKHPNASSIFKRTPKLGSKTSLSEIKNTSSAIPESTAPIDFFSEKYPDDPSRGFPYPQPPYLGGSATTTMAVTRSSETLAGDISQDFSDTEKKSGLTFSTVRLVGREENPNTRYELPLTPPPTRTIHHVNFCRRSSATSSSSDETEEEALKSPKLSWPLTILVMFVVTISVAVTADWLVEAMDETSTIVSKQWVGLILIPAVRSIAEIITAMNVSVKDQLHLSISVAVGSTIQTALFVIPLMVILAWIMSKPLSLLFDPFVSLVLYLAVQTQSYVVSDGKSNWLEGVILVGFYAITAVAFWFYPEAHSTFLDSLSTCTPSPDLI